MKPFALPALLLIFITSLNNSYGSTILDENEIVSLTPKSSYLTKIWVPSKDTQDNCKTQNQSKNFEEGLRLLAEKKTSLAKQYFLKALDEGYVLGHLYSGALETEDYQTRCRYLYTASQGVKFGRISRETYNFHKIKLINQGFMSLMEWRIKPSKETITK